MNGLVGIFGSAFNNASRVAFDSSEDSDDEEENMDDLEEDNNQSDNQSDGKISKESAVDDKKCFNNLEESKPQDAKIIHGLKIKPWDKLKIFPSGNNRNIHIYEIANTNEMEIATTEQSSSTLDQSSPINKNAINDTVNERVNPTFKKISSSIISAKKMNLFVNNNRTVIPQNSCPSSPAPRLASVGKGRSKSKIIDESHKEKQTPKHRDDYGLFGDVLSRKPSNNHLQNESRNQKEAQINSNVEELSQKVDDQSKLIMTLVDQMVKMNEKLSLLQGNIVEGGNVAQVGESKSSNLESTV
jgi:hypothetical protein